MVDALTAVLNQPTGIQLVITQFPNGAVNVSGPIDNLAFCYGLLEVAKDAIRDHAKQRQEGRRIEVPMIVPANGRV